MKKITIYAVISTFIFTSCKKETKVDATESTPNKEIANNSGEILSHNSSEISDSINNETSESKVKTNPETKNLEEASKKNEVSIPNIKGTWKIAKVEGKLLVKMSENGQEINAPLNMWVGKIFDFKDDGSLIVKDGDKNIINGEYEFDGNFLTAPQLGGKLGIKTVVNGNKMTMTQTPENFYALMEREGKNATDQIKKMFRIPENIVFHLERN